jgi:hypothetical protein
VTETSRSWREVGKHNLPARPDFGIWTPVLDFVTGPIILCITATGRWKPVEALDDCDAGGFRRWSFGRDALLTKKAPLGALVGKLGGSNIAADDAEVFAVGTYFVLNVDKQSGPLYLTINDAPDGFDDNSGEIVVVIKQAQ